MAVSAPKLRGLTHVLGIATSCGDGSAALRVPPAETRLTVYRRTQVKTKSIELDLHCCGVLLVDRGY